MPLTTTTANGLPPPPLVLSTPAASAGGAPPMPMSMTAPPQTSGSRSRPQARKKPNDDAPYLGPSQSSNAGAKRHASDRVEGERQKRKRVDNGRKVERVVDNDGRESLVKFANMPIAAIYRYLAHFDLVPIIYPPLNADDPPPPSVLEHLSGRHISPTPSLSATTPANRPRRESKEQSRRRSSRMAEDEFRGRTPIVADVDDAYRVLAGIAERHLVEQVRREEVDILASFMCKVKSHAKGAPGQPACARRSVRF